MRTLVLAVALTAPVLLLAPTVVPALAQLPAPASERRAEVIRGRVTTDSGIVVVGADVVATMAPNRDVFRTQTDSAGRYQLAITTGTGDYLVHVSALGRRAFRKRVVRNGPDTVFIVDAVLAPAVATLATVTVQAQRQRPPRGRSFEGEPGASERIVDGLVGVVSPDQAGDLAALAGTVPGVSSVEGGISVLGLGPGQNQTTLNGMAFGGSDLPRGAETRTRVSTSAYDPARGGFSGALVDVELGSGGQFTRRAARAAFDSPFLQAQDPAARRLGTAFTRFDLSAAGSGELARDRYYFNTAIQLRRSTSDAVSLLDTDPATLALAGVSNDSVARLVQILGSNGVAEALLGTSLSPVTTSGSLVARINPREFDYLNRQPMPSTWSITAYGRATRQEALGSGLTAAPAQGGEHTAIMAALLGEYSRFFREYYLTTLRSAVTVASDRGRPYARVPNGSVRVSSLLSDGSLASAALGFGGNGLLERDLDRWTWETVSETQFYADPRSRHRVKLYAQSRLDGFDQRAGANRYGTFSYNSLADLATGTAAAYTRTFDPQTVTGGAWSGALALGDQWRPSRSFSLLYGARLESNAFLDRPAHNPAVTAAFGARTDVAPSGIHLSPRIGFTWVYTRRATGTSMTVSNLGSFYSTPSGVLRGGIGEFRSLLPATLLSGATVNTGLSNGARRLLCVGDAVPSPDWAAFARSISAIPSVCADGADGFSDAAPGVELFDPSYTAPRSWRGNLAWSSSYKKLGFALEGLYSLNVDQPSVVDLNFTGTPRFALGDEGGRSVYVAPSAIVPSTGAVSPLDARRDAAFGPVLSRRSENRSVSRQVTVTLTPDLSLGRYFVQAAYSLASTRASTRGFDGAAFGDPSVREWARGDLDVRHQLQLQGGIVVHGITMTMFTRLMSGVPYTPIVSGDVNGDGRGGDRAFVLDPTRMSDPDLAAGMRNLLTGAPSAARECLRRQLGSPAARNGCEGPWRVTTNAQLSIPGRLLRLGDRTNISLFAQNPLGGLDQLLHGRALRGWGATPFPDPVLYTVRGFDPAAQRFTYEVNPRFGSTSSNRTTFRVPFRLTLDVSIDLSRPMGEQQLDRWLGQGRGRNPGVRLNADSLKRRYTRTVPDIYASILREADSLLLSAPQVEALTHAQRAYVARVDSTWAELSAHLAGLGDTFDVSAALQLQEEVTDRVWALAWQEAKSLDTILLPIQIRLLPSPAGMLYRMDKAPTGLRMYFSG